MELKKAKLNRWNNTWSDIFDFTKSNYRTNENHFYLLAENTYFDDFLP